MKIDKKIFNEKMVVFLVCLVFCVASFYRIGHFNLWRDEAFSVNVAQNSLEKIVAITSNDVHPPLHMFILHYWMDVFGKSEVATRVVSVIFGVIAVFFTYKVSTLNFAEMKYRLIATLFAATTPMMLYYAVEVREYSMLVAVTMMTVYFALKTISPTNRKEYVYFSIAAAVGLYVHAMFVIILFSIFVWQFLVIVMRNRFSLGKLLKIRQHLLWVFGSYVVAGVLFLPWLRIFLIQLTRVNDGFWLQFHPWTDLQDSFRMFFTSDRYAANLQWFTPTLLKFMSNFGIAVTVIGALAIKRKNAKDYAGHNFFALLIVIMLGTVWLISFKTPLYFLRYLVFIIPLIGLVFTQGIAALDRLVNKKLVLIFVAVFLIANVFLYFDNILQDPNLKTDYKSAISWIGAVGPNAVILHPHGFSLHSFIYYSSNPGYLYDPQKKLPHYEGTAAFDDSNYFHGQVSDYQIIWVPFHWRDDNFDNILKMNHFQIVQEKQFDGGLTVDEWIKVAKASALK